MLKAWWQAFGTSGKGSCLSIVSCARCAMKEGINWRYISFARTVACTKGLDASCVCVLCSTYLTRCIVDVSEWE